MENEKDLKSLHDEAQGIALQMVECSCEVQKITQHADSLYKKYLQIKVEIQALESR